MRVTHAAFAAAFLLVASGAAVAGPAAAEPTPTPSPEPKTAIDQDGSYVVGAEIVPGTYVSEGPVDGEVCYWKRLSSVGGNDIIDNAMTKKPQVVQIDAGDGAFVTDGCRPWLRSDAAATGPDLPEDVAGWLAKAKLRGYIDTLNRNAQQFGQVPGP